MSNTVPKEWVAATLSELCKFSGGSAFKEKYQGKRLGDYPFIKVSDMNIEGNQRYITNANHWIDQEVRAEAKIKLFPESSVVFAKVGAALLLNRRRILTRDTAIDNNMMAAIPFENDNHFLYYLLQEVDLGEIVQGGAVPSVNQAQMEDIPALIPPLPEQKKIATVLSSIDEVIEKTRAQIDKLKDLKTGMTQVLLTKGIGHTEFKNSPVGRIPIEWDVKYLPEVSENHDSKRVPIKSVERAKIKGSYRYYGASGIIDYVNDYIYDGTYILLGEDGENVLSRNLPLAFIVSGKFWVNNHAHVLMAKPSMDIYFLCEYLESIDYTNVASGSAQPKITKNSLNSIRVPVPPLDEQKAISLILKSIDARVELVEKKLNSVILNKKALMQDLLTGKVRVNVTDKESAVV